MSKNAELGNELLEQINNYLDNPCGTRQAILLLVEARTEIERLQEFEYRYNDLCD